MVPILHKLLTAVPISSIAVPGFTSLRRYVEDESISLSPSAGAAEAILEWRPRPRTPQAMTPVVPMEEEEAKTFMAGEE